MKLSKIWLLLLLTGIFTFTLCKGDIPIDELNNAKQALAEAEILHADKYANAEWKLAKKEMFKSHDLISQSENDDAKTAAKNAEIYAKKASKIAGPIAAANEKKEAQEIMKKADDAYASQFAPEEYNNAEKLMVKGDGGVNKKNYKEAYLAYADAKEYAEKALNISLAQKEQMMNMVAEIQSTIDQAETYSAGEYNPEALAMAKKQLALAKKNIEENKIKEAYPQLQEAKKNADLALAGSQQKWASKKKSDASAEVASAEGIISEFESNYQKSIPLYPQIQYEINTQKENLAAAKEALTSSETYYNEDKYEESYKQSNEAIQLAKIIKEQIPLSQAKLIEYMNKKCPEGYTKSQDGTECISSEDVDDGEGLDGDSENNINTADGIDKPLPPKGWKTYTVKWRKKNTDCLWRIASYKKIYHNSKKWPRIYKANKQKIKNPDLIYPKQVFAIPPKNGDIDTLIQEKEEYPKKLDEWLNSQNDTQEDVPEDYFIGDDEEAPDEYFVPDVNDPESP